MTYYYKISNPAAALPSPFFFPFLIYVPNLILLNTYTYAITTLSKCNRISVEISKLRFLLQLKF